jgi:hypothetical protein
LDSGVDACGDGLDFRKLGHRDYGFFQVNR